MTKVYTVEEVARHNHEKDLWVLINGQVYDITNFYHEHPGGEEVLLEQAGKDATTCFEAVGHSFEALTLRNSFRIGEVTAAGADADAPIAKAESSNEGKKSTVTDDGNWEYRQQQEEQVKRTSTWKIISVAVIFYAILMYYLWF